MKAKLISYDLSKVNQVGKVLVKRQLFGYTEYSNNAKYTYERKGILSNIPHIKLARAVIIVRNQDAKTIEKVIKSVKGKYQTFIVEVKSLVLH
jgi:hypothetical protein